MKLNKNLHSINKILVIINGFISFNFFQVFILKHRMRKIAIFQKQIESNGAKINYFLFSQLEKQDKNSNHISSKLSNRNEE